jgi:nucleotidyltransferase substrate binding protein (TIGR01987 family)
MNNPDIRWRQRFSNYQKALAQLAEAHGLHRERGLSKLEQQGLIQAFEYTYELAWNTLKDYLTYQGIQNLVGSRDTIREAFSRDLIDDGKGWMKMLIDRNSTSHTYNEDTAEEIFKNIVENHFYLLLELKKKMDAMGSGA